MYFKSTRDQSKKVTSAQAIAQGLSAEGGLFVPESLPAITLDTLKELKEKTYIERAIFVLSQFLTDFSSEQLENCVKNAYQADKYKSESITEISHLYEGTYMLELWHGPTCAFKDMALQLLPHLLTTSATIVNNEKEIVILVATSGDTGKAALEGFKDVNGTKIIVFYPVDGVSPMQKRQMTTQQGDNVYVCAINGNFDDAQTAVKTIFTDKELAKVMEQNGKLFSSANSINWGRLVPQIVYYVSAYCDLLKNEEITLGEKINVVVPTGNFGNILAAYYAKKMGVPFDKLICASNENKVLTDFINTGIYNKNREFKATISPSMDILISSNLERLLFDLSGCDDQAINEWFASLNKTGVYEVSDSVKQELSKQFFGGYCTDEETKATIKKVFDRYSYLCDTHTAVAVKVFEEYKQKTGDTKKAIIASTANPYKFTASVLSAVSSEVCEDEYEQVAELNRISGLEVPQALANLKQCKVRFEGSIEKQDIKAEVTKVLHL
ncbi:threonine synthase [Paludicola sp. MB14-C6]|uniref:threonine synthase n=1 Tax=Paludihabitans sp. MB14-C6 TaxID=3070656 RepID=UPI0027DB38F1|nr:threonine synthase [Paludicola sp. MB14-C6]WMJ24444.1 threonine synthase [Paludicola sp. MB14-C6]